ncbi:MAG: hypothetical protein AAFV45_09985 [Pseudomonadota bacterium]
MAKENPMPPLFVHILGLGLAGLLVWACYWIWQVMPQYTGPTLLNSMRIVCALLAMFMLLTVAHVLTKLIRRVASGKAG